jgi:hypothetical protein
VVSGAGRSDSGRGCSTWLKVNMVRIAIGRSDFKI